MAFLVYFFVLLVAAGSVIFGLDLTQAPLTAPSLATPPAQTATVAPAPPPAPVKPAAAPRTVVVAKAPEAAASATAAPTPTPAPAPAVAPAVDDAAQAHASATPADTTAPTPVAAASCNVSACSAAYRSFRASDCTYQPSNGERRLCSKSATTGKVAAAAHPRSIRRVEPRDDRRFSDRRDFYDGGRDAYDDRRGGWGFFGGGDDY